MAVPPLQVCEVENNKKNFKTLKGKFAYDKNNDWLPLFAQHCSQRWWWMGRRVAWKGKGTLCRHLHQAAGKPKVVSMSPVFLNQANKMGANYLGDSLNHYLFPGSLVSHRAQNHSMYIQAGENNCHQVAPNCGQDKDGFRWHRPLELPGG